jgi:hypothetical protein
MPALEHYHQFDGRHWETGTVANFLAYRGVKAPHTGKPYSEALLMGISGGAVMGYFTFAYEGYDPTARILTRNTFDPWDTMLSRLGVAQNVHQTAKPDTAVRNLVSALEEGTPAIVWADVWTLPYNALSFDDGMWAIFPILVYGYDEAGDVVRIADRARMELTTTTGELAAARGRTKKSKHRLITLEAPDENKLSAAVMAGVWDCLHLYTEAPPRGSKNNFGLAAFRRWAELLKKPKARASWEREFPAGVKMLSGLTSAFSDIALFGKDEDNFADRRLYADFLDEAAVILGRPGLGDAASRFRDAAAKWGILCRLLLPDEPKPFRQTRELMARRHTAFLELGNAALDEMRDIDSRLAALRTTVATDFPLTQQEVEDHRSRIAAQVMMIHDVEAEAIETLKATIA